MIGRLLCLVFILPNGGERMRVCCGIYIYRKHLPSCLRESKSQWNIFFWFVANNTRGAKRPVVLLKATKKGNKIVPLTYTTRVWFYIAKSIVLSDSSGVTVIACGRQLLDPRSKRTEAAHNVRNEHLEPEAFFWLCGGLDLIGSELARVSCRP